MRIPAIRGVIERRILVNYRVDPDALRRILPAPFRPQLVDGVGIGGICLIRLRQIRPRSLPAVLGISSENAAHRIAVRWEQDGEARTGVYIPRRDTSSRLNALLGGRVFPGVHHHARFESREQDGRFSFQMISDDRSVHVAVEASCCENLPSASVFSCLQQASDFFERGSRGYSATSCSRHYEGLELRTFNWDVVPLSVERVESSFFDDRRGFPDGTTEFDSALLMQDIEHEWHGRDSLQAV